MGFGLEFKAPVDDKCPKCNSEVKTGYIDKDSPKFKLDPISGDFPGATRRWEKMREQKMAQEKKNMKNHGTYT